MVTMLESIPVLPAAIRAPSERQAMDWTLVLASQGIDVTLARDPLDGAWCLLVAPADEPRARAAIRLYRIENRGFEWRHELPGSDVLFDGRVVFWALAVAFIFLYTGSSFRPGIFDTELVRQGEWWRAFTAEWLHRDVAHLFSNLAIGMLFLGLAMARFGSGVALLGSLLAGALANLTGLLLRGEDYRGLGASGLVMGALGMVIAQAVPYWRSGRRGNRIVFTSLGTGALLFFLLGSDPSSDVLAHAAGFIYGIVFGAIAARIGPATLSRLSPFAFAAFLFIVIGTWFLALLR